MDTSERSRFGQATRKGLGIVEKLGSKNSQNLALSLGRTGMSDFGVPLLEEFPDRS